MNDVKHAIFKTLMLLVPGLAALAVALPAAGATAGGIECRLPATPEGARLQMVAPEMRVSDVASTIRIMRVPVSPEATLEWYRKLWAPLATPQRPGSREDDIDGWRVISTVQGPCFTTVQVRADGNGTYALVSVLERPDPATKRVTVVKDFPVMPGSRIESDATFVDGAVRNGRTLVISSTSHIAANVAFYERAFRDQGWVTVMRRQPEGQRGVSYVMAMRRGAEQMDVVIAPGTDGEINVVAHMVNRP